MNQAVNVKISALQAACMELTRYMTKANETFNNFLTAVPGRADRWEVFLREKVTTKEVSISELAKMVDNLGDEQIIEAEVVIR